MNNMIFDTVLKANRDYVEAVENDAKEEIQNNLLMQCEILMKTMILDAGLANDYAEYCKARR